MYDVFYLTFGKTHHVRVSSMAMVNWFRSKVEQYGIVFGVYPVEDN